MCALQQACSRSDPAWMTPAQTNSDTTLMVAIVPIVEDTLYQLETAQDSSTERAQKSSEKQVHQSEVSNMLCKQPVRMPASAAEVKSPSYTTQLLAALLSAPSTCLLLLP